MSHEFDVVVFGATGYTGRLVAAYLSEAPSCAATKWAICGRSRDKLESLAKSCAEKGEGKDNRKPAILVADVSSKEELEAAFRRAKVVIACAGPFSQVGMPVAEACVASGTHYVDITGEFPYVRRLIEQLHDQAVAKNVVLLPCSGFDCVASDMANVLAFQLAKDSDAVKHVEVAFRASGGLGVSRGTLESILLLKSTMTRADLSRLSLVARDRRQGMPTPQTRLPYFHNVLNSYVGPYVMAAINERIVRRSNSLSSDANRRTAGYMELYRGSLIEVIISVAMQFAVMLMLLPGVATLLRKFVFPVAGEGPDPTKKGGFVADVMGFEKQGQSHPTVHGRITCSVTGYIFTAIAAVETALAVANDEMDDGVPGGVRTVGCTLTEALPRRLQATGKITYETIVTPKKSH